MNEFISQDIKLIQSVADKYKLASPDSARRFSSGQINRVYEIDGKYVLKIKGERVQGLDLFGWQTEILNKLRSVGLKVPHVLGSEKVGNDEYLLMEKMSGQVLSGDWLQLSEARREAVMADLGEQLRLFHSLPMDSYKVPLVTGTPFKVFRPAVEGITNFSNIDKEKLGPEYRADLEYLESFFGRYKTALDESDTAVPVHHDINLENILWENGKISGIIDVDWMCSAPRDYELKRIVHYAHTPKYGVSKALEASFENRNMEQEVKWLKKSYPELFVADNLVERIRLYLIDQLLPTVRGYCKGEWSENAMQEWHGLVEDYYRNDWLPRLLE